VEHHILPFIAGQEFNLAKLFLIPAKRGENETSMRLRGIIYFLGIMATQGTTDTFFEARQDEPVHYRKPMINAKASALLSHLTTTIEPPCEHQLAMLSRGFPDFVNLHAERKKGSMGRKSGLSMRCSISTSGLNMRTKEGKATYAKREDEVKQIANGYLDRLLAKDYKAFFSFVHKTAVEAYNKKKGAGVALRASVEFAKSEAKASVVPPEQFAKVMGAFYENESKGKERAEVLKAEGGGRAAKFWIPRGKKLYHSFV
jgi:hypothetical protein